MKIILGEFQSGKSRFIVEQAISHIQKKESFLIITPSRLLKMEVLHRILAQTEAFVGDSVVTLQEFQHKLKDKLENSPQPISNFEQFLIITNLCSQLEPQLKAFKNISRRPNLIKSLYRIISALRDEQAEDIPSNEAFLERTEDIKVILSSYQQLLREQNLTDGAGLTQFLIQALPQVEGFWPQHLYIDGFTDFTTVQTSFICALMNSAEKNGCQTTLTLTESVSFIAQRSIQQVKASLPQAEISQLTAYNPLGESFLRGESAVNPPKIVEIQAFGVRKECAEVLNQVQKLCVSQQFDLSDIILVVPNHEVYAPVLRSVARKAKIPLWFTRDDLLSTNPFIVFLRQCLQFMTQPLTHQELSLFSKSSYIDLELRNVFASAPLLIPQSFQGSVQQWREILSQNSTLEENEFPLSAYQKLDEALELLQVSLHSFLQYENKPMSTYLDALIRFLEDSGVLASIHHKEFPAETIRDTAALKKIKNILNELQRSLTLTNVDKIPLTLFIQHFENIISETRYRFDSPLRNTLKVLSHDEARGLNVKAVFLLGMSEGSFPPPPSQDLFDSVDRSTLNRVSQQVLGRKLWTTSGDHFDRSKFLFASALSLAKEYVFLCRTPVNEKAEYFAPSHFLVRLLAKNSFECIPDYYRKKPRDHNPEIYALYVDPETVFISGFLQTKATGTHTGEVLSYRQRILEAQEAFEEGVLPKKEVLPYFGGLGAHSYAAKRYQNKEIYTSPTRLEMVGRCFYRGLWEYVWNIRPLELPSFLVEAVDAGTLYHNILESYVRQAGASPLDASLLKQIIREQIELSAKKEIFQLDEKRIYGILRLFLQKLELTMSGQKPYQLELNIKELEAGKQIIPLSEEKSLRLSAKIDRIDRFEDGSYAIIDYKTTGSSYKSYHKTAYSLFQGALYALIAQINGISPISEINYLFLEKNDGFSEYPITIGREKRTIFNSINELTSYKKLEILSLIDQLAEGNFYPYTLENMLSSSYKKAAQSIFDEAFSLEYENKCSYCPYHQLCLRRDKLVPAQ
ncbi:MAG: PD-(D/E)XK nuclease family protein [Brevinema sp.]